MKKIGLWITGLLVIVLIGLYMNHKWFFYTYELPDMDIQTGHNIPEGCFDRITEDGYSYNSPKPIQEDWITEPAWEWYPATVDKINLTSSRVVPRWCKIYQINSDKTSDINWLNLRFFRYIKESNWFSKKDFSIWLKNYTNLEFVFAKEYWEKYSILITGWKLDEVREIKNKIINDTFFNGFLQLETLPKFRWSQVEREEFRKFLDATQGDF